MLPLTHGKTSCEGRWQTCATVQKVNHIYTVLSLIYITQNKRKRLAVIPTLCMNWRCDQEPGICSPWSWSESRCRWPPGKEAPHRPAWTESLLDSTHLKKRKPDEKLGLDKKKISKTVLKSLGGQQINHQIILKFQIWFVRLS